MYTADQLNTLLEQPMYGWDTLALLGDIEDFLNFSELNIQQQFERELKRTRAECAGIEFDDPSMSELYRSHQIENVTYRFEVSLVQRVRYSGLTVLMTSIEWTLIALERHTKVPLPKVPKGVSESVHRLTSLAVLTNLTLEPQISLLSCLIQVRNCIIHSAGRIETYRHKEDLRKKLIAHIGIKLSRSNFLGEGIEIEQGYLQSVLEDTKNWLVGLEKAMHQQGQLR